MSWPCLEHGECSANTKPGAGVIQVSLLDIRQGDSREAPCRVRVHVCACVHVRACACSCFCYIPSTRYTIEVRTVLGIEGIWAGHHNFKVLSEG